MKQDFKRTGEWYGSAVELEDPRAMFNLAQLLATGKEGVEKNEVEALALLYMAVQTTNETARAIYQKELDQLAARLTSKQIGDAKETSRSLDENIPMERYFKEEKRKKQPVTVASTRGYRRKPDVGR